MHRIISLRCINVVCIIFVLWCVWRVWANYCNCYEPVLALDIVMLVYGMPWELTSALNTTNINSNSDDQFIFDSLLYMASEGWSWLWGCFH